MSLTLTVCRARRALVAALLYAGACLGAIPASAAPDLALDLAPIEALKAGQMKGLKFHDEPLAVSKTAIMSPQGEETTLAALAGRVTVLNFWATWCGPCRAEMPTLDALQKELGGDEFAVTLVASGPQNQPKKINRFFEMEGIEALESYRDPNGQAARDMGILGLPITVILDPEGREIARLRGDADWASDEALTILRALIAAYAKAS